MRLNRRCMPRWVSRRAGSGNPDVLSFTIGSFGPIVKDTTAWARLRRMPQLLTLDRRDDGVALVTLANGKVNALSRGLLAELRETAEQLTAEPPGAVVITGGERIFAAGADISEFGGPGEAG